MEENKLFEERPEQYSLCLRVRKQLPDYVEGVLDAMAAEAIRAHLSVCYLCSKELEEMRQTIRLIETLPFVEPVKDFAPAIMAALDSQSGHSFQTPVVEMETASLIRDAVVHMPRTTTGHERQRQLRISDFGFRIGKRRSNGLTHVGPEDAAGVASPRERILTAAGLTGLLGALIARWGPAALDSQQGASAAVSGIPGLSAVAAFASNLFSLAGEAAGRLFEMIGRVPLPIIILDAAVVGLAASTLANRRAKRARNTHHA